MNATPPSLPQNRRIHPWLLRSLWLAPGLSIRLMILVGLFLMLADSRMDLVIGIFGVIYIALLSILSEIHGRVKSTTGLVVARNISKIRMRHSTFYFCSQLIIGPCIAWTILAILHLLAK